MENQLEESLNKLILSTHITYLNMCIDPHTYIVLTVLTICSPFLFENSYLNNFLLITQWTWLNISGNIQ